MKRILLVDDSRLVLRMGEAVLRGRYQVITAGSGTEAVRKAVDDHPDMIVTDLNMPGLDGAELRELLARDTRTCDIKVVIATTADEIGRLGSGVDHLEKPFDGPSLLGKVTEYLH